MSYLTDKLWGVYKEFRDIGLNVSLSVSFCNGAETFVFQSVPSHGVAGLQNRGRRRRRRGRGGRTQQTQPSAAGPSYADVARSPPSPLQSRIVKRARRTRGAAAAAESTAVSRPSSPPSNAVSRDTGTAPSTVPALAADVGAPVDVDAVAAVAVPVSPLAQLDGESGLGPAPDSGSPPTIHLCCGDCLLCSSMECCRSCYSHVESYSPSPPLCEVVPPPLNLTG